ncbi:origin recognition complex subunit 2-like [Convolutriloba macropyga]|uniref:origin recognition complex subunit 2-like n=1 Tax=Convolutriloba macropyga TaxID=536237 RepID=UPI003F5270C1
MENLEENDDFIDEKTTATFAFRKKGKNALEKQFAASSQHFFESSSNQPSANSGGPSSGLDASKVPLIDSEKYSKILKTLTDSHQGNIDILQEKYQDRYFLKWLKLMYFGYNILLHGYGSKVSLIEDFRQAYLLHFHHVVIKGFYPGLTMKHIMSSLSDNIDFGNKFTPNSLDKFCSEFAEHFQRKNIDLFIVIPSMDSAMVKIPKLQQLLLNLTKIPKTHIVASIDHINADLLWDTESKCQMNWLKFDCTTYENYTIETSFENSLLHNSSGALALSSLANVAASLTPNAKKILEVIISFYLNSDDSKCAGMLFQNCYLQCRENFLVNSDLSLRAQLTEFIDHGLVSMKKNSEGGELIILNLTRSVMSAYLENNRN